MLKVKGGVPVIVCRAKPSSNASRHEVSNADSRGVVEGAVGGGQRQWRINEVTFGLEKYGSALRPPLRISCR
jgi:hypothetical protein